MVWAEFRFTAWQTLGEEHGVPKSHYVRSRDSSKQRLRKNRGADDVVDSSTTDVLPHYALSTYAFIFGVLQTEQSKFKKGSTAKKDARLFLEGLLSRPFRDAEMIWPFAWGETVVYGLTPEVHAHCNLDVT